MFRKFRDLYRYLWGLSLLVVLGFSSSAWGQEVTRNLNVLSENAPYNREVMPLLWWSIGLSVLVLGGTGAALIYVVQKFRLRPTTVGEPAQFHGNNLLEMVLLGIPLVMVAVLSILTAQTLTRVNSIPKTGTLKVDVKGFQFWWDFNYPELKIHTSNELVIPVGVPIELQVTSNDVIHDFWITSLGAKRDAIPGQQAHFALTAEKPGIYYGQCLALCGASHANMRFHVVALSPEDYSAWKTKALTYKPAPAAADSEIAKGRTLFEGKGNCSGCHAIKGTAAQGAVAPQLSYFGDHMYLGAGIFKNERSKVKEWIANSASIKPGSLMPNYDGTINPNMKTPQAPSKLTDAELESLAIYLESNKLDSEWRKKFGNTEF
jgi:cytochrome c oxidase subunit II